MRSPTISQIGELALIDDIRKQFSQKIRGVTVGIGDDAAVIQLGDTSFLVTTDMMVEGVHFNLRFITPYQLGFKLISVNVSDIYAMGGTPHYVLLNIALHRDTPAEFIHMLMTGVKDAMNIYHTVLVGGDLSSTPDGIALSATLIGYARKYVLRSGARVGDRIYVTGSLGDSACGLHVLKKMGKTVCLNKKNVRDFMHAFRKKCGVMHSGTSGFSWRTLEPLVRRHLMPEARNPQKFIRHATAMIDISDGILVDLTRLCNESGTGAKIYEKKIPVSTEMKKTATCFEMDPMVFALTGGEDYELLFTAPQGKKIRATCIGEISTSERIIENSAGRERAFSAEGYQHFR
ncbi:MAG: thiL [Nitrospirae bacterium]|nr:thiL [Nitrospirota bacterium]